MYAVITGISKGLGRAIAVAFAQKGYHIIGCSREVAALIQFQQDLQTAFPHLSIFTRVADMADKKSVQHFAAFVQQHASQISVLVNNAGTFQPSSIQNETDNTLEQTLATNVYGAYYLTKALMPQFVTQKNGHIFNIGSIASRRTFDNCAAYTISKHALQGFSQVLREELKPQGVRVTTVLPGAIFTDSWSGSDIDPNRLMSAEDIAQIIVECHSLSSRTVVEEIVLRPQLGDL